MQALALDIGATKLGVALVGADGEPTGWRTTPTRRDEGPDAVLERLFALADGLLADRGPADAAGISCGGPLDPRRGLLLGPLHLPGWDRVPIVRLVEERFGLRAHLLNDASAGAWGEFRHGAARDAASSLYLTVSSGMGGGAVVDGRLLVGASGNGGEPGHVLVRAGGRRCLCGRRGCAEAYVAGTQMAARVREERALRPTALPEDATAEQVFALSGSDELAHEIWTDGVEALASAVVTLVNVLEPEVVVIGGGLTNAGEALLGPVRTAVAEQAMAPIAAVARVVPAALGAPVCAVGIGAWALEQEADA
ncbi:ROK family protein [Amnibacterium endophyticum]|uniref:ROK family protein n=1 Tax=Amnibacterium endophyticum TaxID=2109337 RepID=A0ABW4LII2_9MICO